MTCSPGAPQRNHRHPHLLHQNLRCGVEDGTVPPREGWGAEGFSAGSATASDATRHSCLAVYTCDKLPDSEHPALPNEGHVVAARKWRNPIWPRPPTSNKYTKAMTECAVHQDALHRPSRGCTDAQQGVEIVRFPHTGTTAHWCMLQFRQKNHVKRQK
jgi:hypothetical protein